MSALSPLEEEALSVSSAMGMVSTIRGTPYAYEHGLLESAGPPSTVDQSAPFPVADRRGSLFSVDPAEILGMVNQSCAKL